MPEWAAALLSSLVITFLFLAGLYALGSSEYADWVRDFYAKHDRLQMLFAEKNKKPNQK
jgi:hypothetical protein